MFYIRQSFRSDLDAIFAVAEHLDSVNLPANREHLESILDLSSRSFDGSCPESEREYLFVLVDAERDTIVGTSMIHAQHGTRRAPHVFFSVENDERYSETLDRYFVHQTLRIGYNYDGPSEIGGLILLPQYRRHKQQLGKLLSYMRFLFIKMHRPVFRDKVVSELLPPLEDNGTSVLWEQLGKRFTGLTYQEADILSKHNKEFIRALFPHTVIYTSLLPKEVQAVIGHVGPDTKGVEKMLRRIGFQFANQIDPFDGGPHFIAETDSITLVRDSRQVRARRIDTADESRPWAILATSSAAEPSFVAVGTRVIPGSDDASVGVPGAALDRLGVGEGERVWIVLP